MCTEMTIKDPNFTKIMAALFSLTLFSLVADLQANCITPVKPMKHLADTGKAGIRALVF